MDREEDNEFPTAYSPIEIDERGIPELSLSPIQRSEGQLGFGRSLEITREAF